MSKQWHSRALRGAGVLGLIAMLELLAETGLGFTSLTTGSPLAYRGVLIEMPAAVWFAVLLLLEILASRLTDMQVVRRWNVYVFGWSILGLAAALWAFRHADTSVRTNWQYWTAFGCVCISFVAAGTQDQASLKALTRTHPKQIVAAATRDIRFLSLRSAFGLLLVGCAALATFGPTAADVPSWT